MFACNVIVFQAFQEKELFMFHAIKFLLTFSGLVQRQKNTKILQSLSFFLKFESFKTVKSSSCYNFSKTGTFFWLTQWFCAPLPCFLVSRPKLPVVVKKPFVVECGASEQLLLLCKQHRSQKFAEDRRKRSLKLLISGYKAMKNA